MTSNSSQVRIHSMYTFMYFRILSHVHKVIMMKHRKNIYSFITLKK